ncbi:hypothetical protein [Streptomyces collinus]|uniref:hypothetical protein n=1 Tax=Streptomyces collinus TaxID=42684 RepID=UPI0033DD73A0
MTTMHRGDDRNLESPRPPILSESFDDFLAQAEHDLHRCRRRVRALRRRARRQSRRDFPLRTRAARFFGRVICAGFAVTGSGMLIAAPVQWVAGDASGAADALTLAAGAWGTAAAWRTRH